MCVSFQKKKSRPFWTFSLSLSLEFLAFFAEIVKGEEDDDSPKPDGDAAAVGVKVLL